jgi:hypothetical protein
VDVVAIGQFIQRGDTCSERFLPMFHLLVCLRTALLSKIIVANCQYIARLFLLTFTVFSQNSLEWESMRYRNIAEYLHIMIVKRNRRISAIDCSFEVCLPYAQFFLIPVKNNVKKKLCQINPKDS